MEEEAEVASTVVIKEVIHTTVVEAVEAVAASTGLPKLLLFLKVKDQTCSLIIFVFKQKLIKNRSSSTK